MSDWIITDISPVPSPARDEVENEVMNERPVAQENVKMPEPSDQHEDAKFKWLSGPWPIKEYPSDLPMKERKAEWFRFRDQFERIASCKPPVNPTTKLTGLKIHVGSYLLSIIELQEKNIENFYGIDIFKSVKEALDEYFTKMCDTGKERMKFRTMMMNSKDAFEDFILSSEILRVY